MSELHTVPQAAWVCDVRIPAGEATLKGNIHLPTNASGIVLFAHGSGSSRYSPRNQYVAQVIRAAGIGTLLFDLLTPEEEVIDLRTHSLRFDIQLLAERLEDATGWVAHTDETRCVRIGYFGASTGGGAALLDPITVRFGGVSEDRGLPGRRRHRLAPRYRVCYTFPMPIILPCL